MAFTSIRVNPHYKGNPIEYIDICTCVREAFSNKENPHNKGNSNEWKKCLLFFTVTHEPLNKESLILLSLWDAKTGPLQ